jgi:hypothetical protein
MLAGVAACLAVYVLVGGWGPPSPLGFAVVGVIFGVTGARRSWEKMHVPALERKLAEVSQQDLQAFFIQLKDEKSIGPR